MHLMKKDTTTYKARMSGYHIEAFGKRQTLALEIEIEIYHASAWPCVWSARPQIAQGPAKWTGDSPEAVQKLVERSFAKRLTDWQPWHNGPFGTTAPKGPQLVRSKPKVAQG